MIGPDAARYLAVAQGIPVSRPFNLRQLWPAICGTSPLRWWVLWGVSWPVAGFGYFMWQGADWAGVVLLLALPGILGPAAVIPVGVDLPTLAVSMLACWVFTINPGAGCLLVVVAAAGKEPAPIWVAMWLWNPLPLVALVVPFVGNVLYRTGPDPLGERFEEIARHPIRSAFAAHRGRWRDGWLMVAPWGACLAALHRPSLQLVVVLAVAYLQLVVATDSVRLYQYAAGPLMAATAAQVIPVAWLPLVCVLHVVWWRVPERV